MDTNADAIFNTQPTDGIDGLPTTPGIYCWINRVTGRRLVGQTRNLRRRGLKYRSDMKRGAETNLPLRRDVEVHGYNVFFMFVLEHCDPDLRPFEMHRREIWWTIQLQAHVESSGYNSEAGHRRTRASRFRDRERKMLNAKRGCSYWLLPDVDLYDPIHPLLLNSWVPGS